MKVRPGKRRSSGGEGGRRKKGEFLLYWSKGNTSKERDQLHDPEAKIQSSKAMECVLVPERSQITCGQPAARKRKQGHRAFGLVKNSENSSHQSQKKGRVPAPTNDHRLVTVRP